MTNEQLEKGNGIWAKLKDAKEMKTMLESEEYVISIAIKNKNSQYVNAHFNQHKTTCSSYQTAINHIRSYFLGVVDREIKTLEDQLRNL